MKPHELRPEHANRLAWIVDPDEDEMVLGYIGLFNHTFSWYEDRAICEQTPHFYVGGVTTELYTTDPRSGALTTWFFYSSDDAEIILYDEGLGA